MNSLTFFYAVGRFRINNDFTFSSLPTPPSLMTSLGKNIVSWQDWGIMITNYIIMVLCCDKNNKDNHPNNRNQTNNLFFLARSALVKYLMINWSNIGFQMSVFYSTTLLSLSQSKVVNYLIFQDHLLWAISKINTVQYSLLSLSRFLLCIKMSIQQQAFRVYISALCTFFFYWCLINHKIWLFQEKFQIEDNFCDLLW